MTCPRHGRTPLLALLAVLVLCHFSCSDDSTPAGPGSSSLTIFINEFLANNRSGIVDPDFGAREDWIELFNGGDADVDMGGFFLTDALSDPERWAIPAGTVIEGGGYLLVWADGRNVGGTAPHAGFRLSSLGEEIGLFDANGASIDQVAYGEQQEDISTGRTTDGASSFATFERPTPGASNSSSGPDLPPAIVAVFTEPSFPLVGDVVTVTAVITDDSLVASVSLHFDAGSASLQVAMSEEAPDTFTALIPSVILGTTVSYYIEATDHAGSTTYSPPGAPDATWTYTVGEEVSDVWINEFLASNDSLNTDPDFGGFGDWVEIFNGGQAALDLGGWTITDDLDNPDNWTFPAGISIPAGGYLLIWADGEDSTATAPHTDFRLSRSGEQLGLFHPSGAPVDTLTYGVQTTDVSFGRFPDGSDTWVTFDAPTPGSSNGAP